MKKKATGEATKPTPHKRPRARHRIRVNGADIYLSVGSDRNGQGLNGHTPNGNGHDLSLATTTHQRPEIPHEAAILLTGMAQLREIQRERLHLAGESPKNGHGHFPPPALREIPAIEAPTVLDAEEVVVGVDVEAHGISVKNSIHHEDTIDINYWDVGEGNYTVVLVDSDGQEILRRYTATRSKLTLRLHQLAEYQGKSVQVVVFWVTRESSGSQHGPWFKVPHQTPPVVRGQPNTGEWIYPQHNENLPPKLWVWVVACGLLVISLGLLFVAARNPNFHL